MNALVAGLVVATSGCGTIINGRTQRISVTTEPAGAWAKVGSQKITTPGELELPRRELHTIQIGKDGYQPSRVDLSKRISPCFFGNIPLCGIILAPLGMLVDDNSGGCYVNEPTHIDVALRNLPPGVTLAQLFDAAPHPMPETKVDDLFTPCAMSGRARICVLRPGALGNKTRADLRIGDGDITIGTMTIGSYLCWNRSPATTTIKASNGDAEYALDLQVLAGHTYFVQVSVKIGGRFSLAPIDANQASLLLQNCTPVPSDQYIPVQ